MARYRYHGRVYESDGRLAEPARGRRLAEPAAILDCDGSVVGSEVVYTWVGVPAETAIALAGRKGATYGLRDESMRRREWPPQLTHSPRD
jgi:hypothetical protein